MDRGNLQVVHQDKNDTAAYGLVGTSTSNAYKQDQALRALQVAAIAGFVGIIGSAQASCLSVCNTIREHVPSQRVKIKPGAPPSILGIVFSRLRQERLGESSRLFPLRRVLQLQINLEFIASISHRHQEETETKRNEEAGTEGCDADAVERSLARGNSLAITDANLPAGTNYISISALTSHIGSMTLPTDLEQLCFCQSRRGHSFSIEKVVFPGGLREIFLGCGFNQPIEGIDWPRGLERLSMPGFNQSIRDVQWPPALKALEFVSPSVIKHMTDGAGTDCYCDQPDQYARRTVGHKMVCGRFNQPLDAALPLGLVTLWLSGHFKQPLDGVAWPNGITVLGLEFNFDDHHFSQSITWPSNLQHLFTVGEPVPGVVYPENVNVSMLIYGVSPGFLETRSFTFDVGQDCNDFYVHRHCDYLRHLHATGYNVFDDYDDFEDHHYVL